MRTVKEISELTGISVHTLHYYDEIGLLKPARINEEGYRLYDDKALDALQQTLFFKEFDVTLKDIKSILANPNFDKYNTLSNQKELLIIKRDRLNNMINLMDNILEGVNHMNYDDFHKEDMEEIIRHMLGNIKWQQLEQLVTEHGSIEAWKKKVLGSFGSSFDRENLSRLINWYASKDKVKDIAVNSISGEEVTNLQNKIIHTFKKINMQQLKGANSVSVQNLVKKYEKILKQLYQTDDVGKMLRDQGRLFKSNVNIINANDLLYGAGASKFIGEAIEFYVKKELDFFDAKDVS